MNFKREKLRKIESKHLSITLTRSEVKLLPTKTSKSKKDWTTWRKAERSEKKSIWKGKRSSRFNKVKYRISKKPE